MTHRKVRFIETAMKLFAEKGYHATSIQDIVEAWGISKGAFYHHFSSKEDLMLSIVKHHFEKLFSQFMNDKPEGESEKKMVYPTNSDANRRHRFAKKNFSK